MKLALLTGLAAAVSLAGAATAQAEVVYTADPYYAAPAYSYSVPAPLPGPRYGATYVVPGPGYTVMAEPPAVVYAPAPAPVVNPPMVIAPRAAPREGIVTTGYSSGCYIDFRGMERCY